jgi:PAS domain S-box-containing protein
MKPKKNISAGRRPPSLELFLQPFLENSPVILWSMNLDGLVEFSLGQGLEWLGVTPQERIGKSVFEIYRDYPAVLAALRRAVQGESFTEVVLIGNIYFEAKFVPRRDAQGQLIGSIGIATDVTDRQKNEELMDRREQHYRSLIENSHDVIYILDGTGHRTYESPSVEKVLGYKPGERAGSSVYEYIHPEDHSNVREIFEKLAHVPGVTYRVELRARHKAGGWRHVEVAITNLLEDPAVRGWVINFWDITELKRAGEIVEKQEQYYRALTENTHELVVLLDREAVIRFATPSIQKILGYPLADRLGKNFLEWVHPEDLYRAKEVFTQTYLSTGRTMTVDFRAKHLDGSWRFLEAAVTNLFNHPAVEGMILNARDVTERKKTDEVLKDRERYFRALTENAYDVVYVIDREGRRFYESPSTERVLGFRPGDRDPKNTFSYLHPDDQAAGQAAFQKSLQNPGMPVSVELRTRHKDGRWIDMEVVATNLLDVAAVRGVVVNCRDITERKKAEEDLRHSEERFRNLIESSHDVVNVFDREGKIQYVSPSVKRVLGYDPAELAGQTSWEWIHPEDLAAAQPVFEKVLGSPGESKTVEIRLRHKDGSYKNIDLTLTNLLENPAVRGVIATYRDVTERVRTEEKFRNLIENSGDVIAVVDQQGLAFYVSPSIQKVMGYGPEAWRGRNFLELIHPEEREAARQGFEQLKTNRGGSWTAEVRALHQNGSWRLVDVTCTNLLADPTVQGVIFNYRDITERYMAEEALKASEERFRNLIENSNDVISLVSAEGLNLYISPSIRKVMGYDPDERMGRNFFELVHPDDMVWVKEEYGDFLEHKKAARTVQLRAKHQDGSWRTVEVTATNLLDHPTVAGIIFNYRDITERQKAEEALKKSEENFRSLIEKSPDAMIVHTEQKIYYVNEALLRLLGYDRPEELVGRSPLSMVHPDDHEMILIRIRRLKPFEGYNPPQDKRFVRKDGSYIDVETVSFSILFEGAPMVVAIARDLTDRKTTEQALLKYERLGAIGEMAAGMAHEIRNPLSGVQLSAEYLMKKFAQTPEAADQIKNILEQAVRLRQLVDDTLDYSKDKSMEALQLTDVMTLFRTSLRMAQVQYGPNQSRFKVQWKLDWNLYFLRVNPYRVQQVLVNLILNAFQAMGPEGTLTLGCEKEGGMLRLTVEDDGPGIQDKELARMFEPFFTTKTSGSGLGLSVSQKIAESHGGKIRVERIQPHGTVFTLELPAGSQAS